MLRKWHEQDFAATATIKTRGKKFNSKDTYSLEDTAWLQPVAIIQELTKINPTCLKDE